MERRKEERKKGGKEGGKEGGRKGEKEGGDLRSEDHMIGEQVMEPFTSYLLLF